MDGARDAKGRFRGLSGRLRTRSECLVSAVPASKALHAALRTNVLEGLGAAIRRVSHEQQLWAVFPCLRVGSIRLSMNGMARRLVLGLLNLAGCAPT